MAVPDGTKVYLEKVKKQIAIITLAQADTLEPARVF
jgi:hypothetical protein